MSNVDYQEVLLGVSEEEDGSIPQTITFPEITNAKVVTILPTRQK